MHSPAEEQALPEIFIRLNYAFFKASGKSHRSDLHFVAVAQARNEGKRWRSKISVRFSLRGYHVFNCASRFNCRALLKWTFIRPTLSLSCFFCSSVRENQWFLFFFVKCIESASANLSFMQNSLCLRMMRLFSRPDYSNQFWWRHSVFSCFLPQRLFVNDGNPQGRLLSWFYAIKQNESDSKPASRREGASLI